ncbi:MAG: glucosaminidase domain-containing protein [Clostridium sp.]|uniref:glucosaminidase domain-containing protein n=1 Tax=Clostridium sp. TaxID=1506 RepID=UPI003F33A243
MKKKLIVAITVLIINGISTKTVWADDYKTKLINEKKKLELKINEYIPQEVKDDYYGMGSLIKLEKKTEDEFEIGISKGNNEYEFIGSTNEYKKAIELIKNKKENKGEIAIIINKEGSIIYTTNGLGRIVNLYNGNPEYDIKHTIKIYLSEKSKNEITYINSGYVDDVPILEYGVERVKIRVSGVEGWINIYDGNYTNIMIVPSNQVINPSFYKKDSNENLIHYISTDVGTANKGHSIILGKAPQWMKEGEKYYSYDGNYFHKNIDDVIDNKNIINIDDVHYNYFSYLPARTKTAYTAEEIDRYFLENTSSKSVLRGKGKNFIEAQNEYGVNAGLMIGIAMNESARGESDKAINKNNIFGLNAVDSNPDQADKFNSIQECINDFAKNWMSKRYLNPENWVYSGPNVGNKSVGMNVRYASDPYWGEKATRYYYELDTKLGKRDFLNYKLGIYRSENEVRNSSNEILYKILTNKNKSAGLGYPVAILEEQNGKYKINPDNQKISETKYYWDKYGFINKSGVEILNDEGWYLEDGTYYYKNYKGEKVTGWRFINNYWYYFNEIGAMQTGWQFIDKEWYYLTHSGAMQKGWLLDNNKWYHLNESGLMSKEWEKIDNKWYRFDNSGVMQYGWLWEHNQWYYLKSSGEMAIGWNKSDGNWYYFNKYGEMKKQWNFIDKLWYYFDYSGTMKAGWNFIDGYWYYLGVAGAMETGWRYINGEWYYLYSSGIMATNTTIDGWYLDFSGVGRKV